MKTYISILAVFSIGFLSCGEEEHLIDASGVFEATEIIVSSEANGKILNFNIQEGDNLKKNALLGQIDSIQLYFTKRQLEAGKVALLASRPDVLTQIEATEREIVKQEYEKKRIEKLLAGDVATQKQMDDIDALILISKARLKSQKSSLSKSVNSIDAQSNTIDVQIEQLEDQIEKCKITSPIEGTVLVKYAEQGEMTGVGKALFKIADVDNMILSEIKDREAIYDSIKKFLGKGK